MGTPDEYCELHAHTNFSFLDGASHPEELIARIEALSAQRVILPAEADHAPYRGAAHVDAPVPADEVPEAVRKATEQAKRGMTRIPLRYLQRSLIA